MQDTKENRELQASNPFRHHHPSGSGDQHLSHSQDRQQKCQERELERDDRMHKLRNYVGMMLEELRYTCDALKEDINKDKNLMIQDHREAMFSIMELNDKTEDELRNKFRTEAELLDAQDESHEVQRLVTQNRQLKRALERATADHQEQIERVRQEGYDIFEENFILNQKISTLEAELDNNTNDKLNELKEDHQQTLQTMDARVRDLEETIKEREESICILERLVKDCEHNHDRRVARDDPQKSSNIFSYESHSESRRNAYQNESFKSSHLYEGSKNGYSRVMNMQELRNLDSSSHGHSMVSPSSPYSQTPQPFSYYRENQPKVATSHLTHGFHLYPIHPQPSHHDRPGHYPLSSMSPKFSPILPKADRKFLFKGHQPKNTHTELGVDAAKASNTHQMSSMKSREDLQRGEQREMRRQASREGKLQTSRDSKVDLAKIQQQLQGLAKELKTELETISKKK